MCVSALSDSPTSTILQTSFANEALNVANETSEAQASRKYLICCSFVHVSTDAESYFLY
jgi:hypothetical protein